MLEKIDLTRKLSKKEAAALMPGLRDELYALQKSCWESGIPSIVVFEGWDAAGKGGNIRRVTERLDPRGYEVMSIAAPSGEDATHHYLWRFWRRLKPPDEKQILVFDRSWYGRVLVERIEGFCTTEEWKRAYREINQFERQLVDFRTILVKFWLHSVVNKLLQKHEVRPDEVVQVFANRPRFQRIARGNVAGEDMYVATGKSDAGRFLIVFFIFKSSQKALIVSARDMTARERRRYGRK